MIIKIKPKIFPIDNKDERINSMNMTNQDLVQDDNPIDLGFRITKNSNQFKTVVVEVQSDSKPIFIDLEAQTFNKIHRYIKTPQLRNQQQVMSPIETNPKCRICFESNNPLIVPCDCKGSIRFIHQECLKTWILKNNSLEQIQLNEIQCEICKAHYINELTIKEEYELNNLLLLPRNQLYCLIVYYVFALILILLGICLAIASQYTQYQAAIITCLVVAFIVGICFLSISIIITLDIITQRKVDQWKITSKTITPINATKILKKYKSDPQTFMKKK